MRGRILRIAAAIALGAWVLHEGLQRYVFAPIGVSYSMPGSGQLTLGLYDSNGRLLKWLVQDEHRNAGANRERWDGRDQWGEPVPAGSYTLKGIVHPPLSAKYLMTVGNPGTPPWPTPDGKGDWLCDESNPQGVATDGKWVFLASPGSEKGSSIIALDEKGQRQWGTGEPRHFHPRCVSIAVAGDYLYALYSGPEMIGDNVSYNGSNAIGRAVIACFDKRTGEPAGFSRSQLPLRVATWPYNEKVSWLWNLRNQRAYTPETYCGQPRYTCFDVAESTNALGIAAAGNKLYVSLLRDNNLLVLNAATGMPEGEGIPVSSPAGLYAIDSHSLLAVSGSRVDKIDLDTRRVIPFITTHLSAPDSVTMGQNGVTYVSDWGDSFQVKAFDVTGRFLYAIGKDGGRPWDGPWEPDGMLVPRGIAVTDSGRLWVAEDDGSPKRTSVWDAQTGAFLKDYLGPMPYGGGTYFWIDPKDPSRVNAGGVRFKVDYKKKTWIPEAVVYRRKNIDDPFTPNGANLQDCQVKILYRNGREYAVVNVQGGRLSILERKGDIYEPVAAFGSVPEFGSPLKSDGTGQIVWDSDVGYHLYEGAFPECFRGHAGDNYTWTDDNGDGLVQPEEMHWKKTLKGDYEPGGQKRFEDSWGCDVSAGWSFFFSSRFRDRTVIYRLDPRGWIEDKPVYNIADARPVVTEMPATSIYGLHVTRDNKLIVSYNFEGHPTPDSIACYDFDGRHLWSVAMPARKAGKGVHANNAVYDFDIPVLGDVICTWLYHGSLRPFFLTSDGLYVGTLLDDTLLARGLKWLGVPVGIYVCTFMDWTPWGASALWSESAKYFYQSPRGDPYIINGGNDQVYIFRIHGMEPGSVSRFEAPFLLKRR